MTLENTLKEMRENSGRKLPADIRAKMLSETDRLRNSGIMDGIISSGDKFPSFSLKNQQGATVRYDDLRAMGPIVFTIFRGHW